MLAEALFRDFVASAQSGVFADSFASAVRRWADRHPIEGALYRRSSIDSAVAELLASSGAREVFAALGNLDETTADVMTRMDLYTMYVPRLARWEAELAADRIAAVAETASDLAARERGAALDAVRAERLALLAAVHKERIAALHEVEEIVQCLTDRSGPSLHDAVRADLKELVKNVEEMRKRLMMDAGETLERVVDHAFFRLVQLLLICAGLVAPGLALYICLFHRRRRGQDVQR